MKLLTLPANYSPQRVYAVSKRRRCNYHFERVFHVEINAWQTIFNTRVRLELSIVGTKHFVPRKQSRRWYEMCKDATTIIFKKTTVLLLFPYCLSLLKWFCKRQLAIFIYFFKRNSICRCYFISSLSLYLSKHAHTRSLFNYYLDERLFDTKYRIISTRNENSKYRENLIFTRGQACQY